MGYYRENKDKVSRSLYFYFEVNNMTAEGKFQKSVIEEIQRRLPEAIILKNDPNYIQGIPDLTIINGKSWGMLECKESANASHQPNQDLYVEKLNKMSFSSFIYPENKEEVLDALEQSLKRRTRRSSCISKPI